jgi:outer membrane murein-binding lipoprotein Lpp
MKKEKIIVFCLAAVVLASLFIIAGCAKPPTEKVTALQSDLASCESKGAKVFAQQEYETVSQKMAELNSMMEQKKYGKASALADSIATEMTALNAVIDTNGRKLAQEITVSVDSELLKLKSLLTPETIKVLGNEAAKTYQDKLTGFDGVVASLQNDMGNNAFLAVYTNADALVKEIAAVSQEITQKVEQTKAAKTQKPTKSKAKPASKKK